MGIFTDDPTLTNRHEDVIEAADALVAFCTSASEQEMPLIWRQFQMRIAKLEEAVARCPGTRAFRMAVQRGSFKPMDYESLGFVLPE